MGVRCLLMLCPSHWNHFILCVVGQKNNSHATAWLFFFNIVSIEESDENKPGVMLDYDKDGNSVGLEILDASQRLENPGAVKYEITS